MSQGLCRKKSCLPREAAGSSLALPLGPWARRRREELLKLLDQLEPPIAELDRAVLEEAKRREDAVLLMSHPGIGPVTPWRSSGDWSGSSFSRSKKIASYLGLIPARNPAADGGGSEPSVSRATPWCAGCDRNGASRLSQDPNLAQDYQRLKFRRGHAVAKVAIARKLAVRMYWMLRSGADYAQLVSQQGSRRHPDECKFILA